MKVQNKSGSRFIKFLNGKAFYVVLCVCLIAVGVAAWSGVETLKKSDQNINPESYEQYSIDNIITKPNIPSEFVETGKNETSGEQNSNTQSDVQSSDTAIEEDVDDEVGESTETAAPVATYFVNPVLGEVIKDFSKTELQYSMTMKDMRLHIGVDIAADVGTPVIAAGNGVVSDVFKDPMYGMVVVIDHGNGILAKYCGLNDNPTVKKGDIVDSTKQIGSVNIIPCESVEQRHLHLEFYKDGKSVSPTEFIVQ